MNETFKDVDWNHVVLNVTERHVPIKTLWQEAKEEHSLDVDYVLAGVLEACAFYS